MSTSIYGVEIDATGRAPYARVPLRSPTGQTGGLIVSSGGYVLALNQAALGPQPAYYHGYLERIDGVCIATGSTGGQWAIRNSLYATGYVFHVIQQPVAPIPGDSVEAVFTTPIRTLWYFGNPSIFSIQASNSLMGTWVFTVNGFMSEPASV